MLKQRTDPTDLLFCVPVVTRFRYIDYDNRDEGYNPAG